MPKIDLAAVQVRTGSAYPQAYAKIVEGRAKQVLGDAAGLTQFGVNLTRLAPGAGSAHRHWHANEDEFIYIIEGDATLVEEDDETILRAGDTAGFKAGVANGHCLINKSEKDVVFLEVGTRSDADVSTYPDDDVDMQAVKKDGERWRMLHKNGEPW